MVETSSVKKGLNPEQAAELGIIMSAYGQMNDIHPVEFTMMVAAHLRLMVHTFDEEDQVTIKNEIESVFQQVDVQMALQCADESSVN